MKAFSGTVDITPALGTALSGWAGRRRTATVVAQALQANFLGLETAEGLIVVLSLDTLFGSNALEETIEEELRQEGASGSVSVISIATHTHFAPALDSNKPILGAPDHEWQQETATRISAAVLAARERLCDAEAETVGWSSASVEIPLSISRRRSWPWPILSKRSFLRFPGIVMAPNPSARIDRTARLAIISDAQEKPVAILLNWAAHPTVYPDRDHISSDYIGIIRDRLRSLFSQPDLPILFMQGFAGDIRPMIATASRQPALRTLMQGPSFTQIAQDEWQSWADRLADHFAELGNMAAIQTPQPIGDTASLNDACAPLSEMLAGDHQDRSLHIRHLLIADGLEFLFVNAEPTSGFVDTVYACAPFAWPVGYAGDVFGYWPTSQQCREGGYEVEGFLGVFGLSGKFRHNNSVMFETLVRKATAGKARQN